jgi:hypothetical protein
MDKRKRASSISGGIFLIGLGVLFLTGWWWPGILVVIGLSGGWEVGVPLKLLVVVIGSFVITLGLYELLVRRFNPTRVFFGLRPKKRSSKSPTAGL